MSFSDIFSTLITNTERRSRNGKFRPLVKCQTPLLRNQGWVCEGTSFWEVTVKIHLKPNSKRLPEFDKQHTYGEGDAATLPLRRRVEPKQGAELQITPEPHRNSDQVGGGRGGGGKALRQHVECSGWQVLVNVVRPIFWRVQQGCVLSPLVFSFIYLQLQVHG